MKRSVSLVAILHCLLVFVFLDRAKGLLNKSLKHDKINILRSNAITMMEYTAFVPFTLDLVAL